MTTTSNARVKSFISGGFGGSLVVLFGHPLDVGTIKIRLMTDVRNEYAGKMMNCIKASIKQDGLLGLYSGMAVPMLTVAPVYAMYFWAFDEGKSLVYWARGNPDEELGMGGILFAGAFSALAGTLVIIPGDLIKVKLQVETAKPRAVRKFSNPISCMREILVTDGIAGFYRGSAITMLREVPSTIVYYSLYESIKHPLNARFGRSDKSADLHPMAILLAGGLAGTGYTFASVPADVIKSRLQSEPRARYPGGVKQVARELVHTNGLLGLYKGVWPALLRNFPSNGACFLGIEWCKKRLDEYF